MTHIKKLLKVERWYQCQPIVQLLGGGRGGNFPYIIKEKITTKLTNNQQQIHICLAMVKFQEVVDVMESLKITAYCVNARNHILFALCVPYYMYINSF